MGEESFILALDTVFNREVLEDGALYFEKSVEEVCKAVRRAESLPSEKIDQYRTRTQRRIEEHYNWDRIARAYKRVITQ
jgi:rhamnosyltransferase